jgi:hypothetical protein
VAVGTTATEVLKGLDGRAFSEDATQVASPIAFPFASRQSDLAGGVMAAQEPLLIAVSALTLFFVVKAFLHILLRTQRPEVEHHTPSGRASDTLVVLAHGMAGRRSFEGAVHLASQALPRGDRLVLRFDARPFANADAFDIANLLEQAIHEAVVSHG